MAVVSRPTLRELNHRHPPQATRLDCPYGDAVRLMQAIGAAARKARMDAQVKQVRIAAAIGEAGVDQSTISRFEGGGGPDGGQPRYLEQYLLTYEQETGRSVPEILRDACSLYEAEPPTAEELAEDLAAALGPDVEESASRRGEPGAEQPASGN